LIDTSLHPAAWTPFLARCKEQRITLVTIRPVEVEFCNGAESSEKLNTKRELVKNIVDDFILPINSCIFEKYLPSLVAKYGQYGRGISLTDYILAGCLMQHARDMLLLTKNPSDFPSACFQLESHILLSQFRTLQCYGIYAYVEKPN